MIRRTVVRKWGSHPLSVAPYELPLILRLGRILCHHHQILVKVWDRVGGTCKYVLEAACQSSQRVGNSYCTVISVQATARGKHAECSYAQMRIDRRAGVIMRCDGAGDERTVGVCTHLLQRDAIRREGGGCLLHSPPC